MQDFLYGPGFLSSRSTLGSDVSLILAIGFTSLFVYSGYIAVNKKGRAHHNMILVSMASMFGYFIFYYYVRRLGLASYADHIRYMGESKLLAGLFVPLFYFHFLIVILATFFAIYVIILGFKTAVTVDGRLVLKDEKAVPSKTLWGIGFVWLAFLAWWLISVHQFSWGDRILFLLFGYFIPAGIVLSVHLALPFKERRHRLLGRICVGLFACLLITSTMIYTLLYIL